MSIGFSSAARNLFLLGSTGAAVVTNFFKTIDQSAGTDGVYLPDEIKYNFVDQKFVLAGSATDSTNGDRFGWFEKRDQAGSAEWDVRVEATSAGVNTTLRAMELDSNDNLIVVGKTGNVPWIAKYSNGGVIDWQSTTNSGDVEYTGVTSDSNGQYYACGSTPVSGEATAFVEKFDEFGVPGWGKSAFVLGRDVVLSRIAANARGEVVAVGYLEDDSSDKGYIVKIDANTGEVLWDRTLEVFTETSGAKQNLWCQDVYIDSNDQIYVVGRIGDGTEIRSFLIKYTAEGNIIWQKETPREERIEYFQVKSDGETEQTVVFGVYVDPVTSDQRGIISKYSKNGDLVWRRVIFSSDTVIDDNSFGQITASPRPLGSYVSLDADPSFYYLLFIDTNVFPPSDTPQQYTFGKISSSGNGLGDFQYADGTGEIYNYEILNVQDKIGRISDGSVRQDTSDLITYPFSANKLLFDDLATQVSNKKRQMDGPDSFEYSGSPAIRPADFQELNLLGDVYSGSGDWLDQSGKGNNAVTSFTTTAEEPFPGAGSVEFDGSNDNLSISSTNIIDTNSFTVECFARPQRSGLTANETFVEFNTGTRWIFGRKHSQGDVIYYWNGSDVYTTNSGTISANQWSHLAWSKDGSTLRMFVNGVLAHTQTGVTGSFTSSLITVGENSDGFEDYQGYISNLRVIQGTALYTSNFTPPTAALTNTGLTPGNDYSGTATSITNAQGNFILSNIGLLFDGIITNGMGGGANGAGLATINFDGTVTWSSSIEVAGNMGATSGQVGGNSGFMRVNGFDVVPEMKAANQYAGGSPITWVNVTSKVGSSGTLSSIGAEWISGVANPFWGGIRLDGVVLVDTSSTGTQLLTAQGGTIVDTSDNAFSITVNGDAAAAVGGTNTVAHNAAGYWEFDGVNDYIQLATNSDLTFADDFSYETWLWTDVQPASNTIWSLPNGQTFQFTTLNSQQELIYYSGPTGNQSFGPLANNTWAHYIITKSGNTITGYLNGVQSWTVTPGSGETHNFSGASIGYRTISPVGFYWDGRMGEVRIYPRALTAAQVFQNYNATREKYTGVPASTDPGLTSTRTPA